MSSEMANREVFSKIVYGIRKWTNPEVETTVVSLGNESDADQWLVSSFELQPKDDGPYSMDHTIWAIMTNLSYKIY